jgi:TFIIF-interacting CTD phosphatase-like protein
VDNSAYCHILQPENAIPMLPYFHYNKDRELESLLEYLRVLVKQKDMRVMLRQTFFYDKYINDGKDPRKIFLSNI